MRSKNKIAESLSSVPAFNYRRVTLPQMMSLTINSFAAARYQRKQEAQLPQRNSASAAHMEGG